MACLDKLAVSKIPVEEYQVNWKIANFSEIRGSTEALKAESYRFEMGSSINFLSKWRCYLSVTPGNYGRHWICTNVGLDKEVAYSTKNVSDIFFTLAIEINEGFGYRSGTSSMFHVLDTKCNQLIPQEDNPYFDHYIKTDGSLSLKIIVNLFNLDMPIPKVQSTLLDIQTQFELKFRENLQRDMDEIFKNPQIEDKSLGMFKVVSSDGREFFINSEILNVRCPKFLLMLTRMRKCEQGLQVPVLGVSGQTLETLLSYVYTGTLLQAWKEPVIFDELRDLARDFQMEDLHEFLEKAFELI